jgi:hypothetical protein
MRVAALANLALPLESLGQELEARGRCGVRLLGERGRVRRMIGRVPRGQEFANHTLRGLHGVHARTDVVGRRLGKDAVADVVRKGLRVRREVEQGVLGLRELGADDALCGLSRFGRTLLTRGLRSSQHTRVAGRERAAHQAPRLKHVGTRASEAAVRPRAPR